ncbi:hypothetical protein I3843_05G178700 [Carya illinoinensis]|nr:hypothetical protein I3843_05G178700 [Carya illinoinensis]
MVLVQRFGKPDIFLTMTCNPSWKEILDELKPHEEVQNRPDLIARIFKAKLEDLKNELFKQEIFCKVAAYVYTIEHQKRGLPHIPREKGNVIGQIVSANLIEGERYYLRILLNHIRGPKSFEDLKTVNGIVVPTFREAANLHGLLNKDNSLEECLEEACLYQMPNSLRRLFATILVYCNPTNPKELWERFEKEMSADFYLTNTTAKNIKKMVLQNISFTLESMGKNINMYHLAPIDIFSDDEEFRHQEIDDELTITILQEDLLASNHLTSEQKNAYELILETLLLNKPAAFFIDGPAGTGKPFLYKTLLAEIRSKHMIALATASSGNLAKLLRLAKLIIWDEAPMSGKHSIEAVDKMLQDINDTNLPFGGKVIVFGGDFRQVLPVIRKSTKEEQIDASLARSHLWSSLIKIKFQENMRSRLDPDFCRYLIKVGNEAIFEGISNYSNNLIEMTNRAILTPKNHSVDEINAIIIEKFPGDMVRYYSFDETIDTSEQGVMEDFLNTLTPNGLPPHELLLKKNCPIMLLRNINPSEGLCNGTRLICCNFNRNVIDAKISVGHHKGKRVFIPIIPFLPDINENNGCPFKRTQFPIKLSFAMTINKSQGQIF